MSMTSSRKKVYNRSWYSRECKIDMKRRRKEYNRKMRHAKIIDEMTSKAVLNLRKLEWNTMS